jgi:hypothetical protein
MSQNQTEKSYEQKYLKYKAKYLELKKQVGKGIENLVANQKEFINPTSPFWKLEVNVNDRTTNKSVGVVTFEQREIGGYLVRPFEFNLFASSDHDIKTVAREFAWPLIKDKFSPAEIEAFNMRGLFRNNYGPAYGPTYGPAYGPAYGAPAYGGPVFGPSYGPNYGPRYGRRW